MCSYAISFAALLGAVVLVQPVESETYEQRRTLEEPLCRFVRSAASHSQLEAEVIARLREAEVLALTDPDLRSPLRLDKSSFGNRSYFRADRELFESSLVDWLFFED